MQNSVRKNLTVTADNLASLSIYVDKMHIRNHTDQWCLKNCDPRKVTKLEEVSYTHASMLADVHIDAERNITHIYIPHILS